jgi:hypothetical protein
MRSSRVFVAAAVFALTAWLSACGGGGKKAAPANQVPTSNAGLDQSAFKSATVTLDGSASTDPDGNALAYRWTQTAGAAVSLSSGTTSRPTFTAPAASGVLTFSLVVNDGHADSIADTIQVSVANRAPSASAGADAAADAGTLFTLDGLGSTDADHDTLTYTWTQLAGPAVTLTTVAPGRARFTAPSQIAHLEFGLVANDGEAASAQDIVAIDVHVSFPNQPPVAYVYGDFTAPKRGVVTLAGGGYDPDGSPVSFLWRQVSGPTITLADAGTPNASFTAPGQPATLVFELVASDGQSVSEPQRMTVTVQNFAPAIYLALGPDAPRTLVDLVVDADIADGDNDPLTVTYAWTRNGTVVPAVTGKVFPASETTRGDVIAVTVTANDGTDSTSVDASTTIEDSPPTLAANAPADVNFGDTVSFQVTASGDDDGDPLGNFIVTLGPAGFDVSGAGAVTWQARLPMFDDYVDIAWSVGVEDAPTAIVNGTIRVHHAARQMPFMRNGGTVPQNREQMLVTDLDADGVDEILVTDGRSLSTSHKVGAGFEQDWAYPFNLSGQQNGISAIAAGNVAGDAKQEIFVATEGRIRELDGVTRKVVHEYANEQIVSCYALRVVDLEGDGPKEVVCLAGSDPYYYSSGATMLVVLNAADLSLKAIINQTGLGISMAVGNVDADAATEIVTAGGYVFDGATRLNEWAYGPQFGTVVDTGDIDGDGVAEIVALNYDFVRVFSAVTRTQRGQVTSGYCCGMQEVRVADIGGDARREVIIGDSQWGNISAFRYNAGTQVFDPLFTLSSQDYGISGIAVGNLDADTAVEIVWGTGVASSGPDKLIVAEVATPTSLMVEWNSGDVGQFYGPISGGHLARTAAGTRRLMFAASSNVGFSSGMRLFALDPLNAATTHSSLIGTNYTGASGIDVGDTDGDNIDEVFVASADGYAPFYTTYDFASDTRKWSSPNGYSSAVGIAQADVSGDGHVDFAVMGADSRVTVFNVAQSNIVWQSPLLNENNGYGGVDVALADLDHDGLFEVIALTSGKLYVFGRSSVATTFTQRAAVAIQNASQLLAADVDGDGEIEIFVVTNVGYYGSASGLSVFDGSLQLKHFATLQARVSNIAVEPSAQPRKNLLVSTGTPPSGYYATSASEIWAIDPISGTGIWRSPQLPGEFSRSSLHAVDVDLDGQYELSFGTSIGAFVTR